MARKNKDSVPRRGRVVIDTVSGRRRRLGRKRRPKVTPIDIVDPRSIEAIAGRLERRDQLQRDDDAAREKMLAPLRKVARQMRRGHRASSQPPETPTPNRAIKSGDLRVDALGAYHCDSVLDGLASRHGLDPKNADKNRLLQEAGQRYAHHWTLGFRVGVAAQDINRVRGAGSNAALVAAEGATHHAEQYRRASQHLGPFFGAVVDAIVLCEEPVESVGRRISGYKSSKQAIAVAMDRLREGLSRLAALWGTLTLDRGAPRSHPLAHESEKRPDGATPSRALRTHRPLAGM